MTGGQDQWDQTGGTGRTGQPTIFCSHCGTPIPVSGSVDRYRFCPRCGEHILVPSALLEGNVADILLTSPENGEIPTVDYHRLHFSGNAKEYFRIWIVNTFLTIITAGFYAAWAKVRTRKYFYSNTTLAGSSFAFLGKPGTILKGNLIVGLGVVTYSLVHHFKPLFAQVAFWMLYAVVPFLVYKSLRFNTRNTAFRNIRFHFNGTMKESYKTYFLYAALIPFTLGIIVPYFEYRRKRLFYHYFAYGTTGAQFTGEPAYFYKIYGIVWIILVGFGITFMGFLGVFVTTLTTIFRSASPESKFMIWPILIMVLMYLCFFVAMSVIQQFIYARIMNHCWESTRIGAIRFKCALSAWRLIVIRITNILAIIVTAGLLAPWAKVRRIRYILDSITVIAVGGLERFTAVVEPDVSALGDSATDFFDIDIGL